MLFYIPIFLFPSLFPYVYIYIYIYIEREREEGRKGEQEGAVEAETQRGMKQRYALIIIKSCKQLYKLIKWLIYLVS